MAFIVEIWYLEARVKKISLLLLFICPKPYYFRVTSCNLYQLEDLQSKSRWLVLKVLLNVWVWFMFGFCLFVVGLGFCCFGFFFLKLALSELASQALQKLWYEEEWYMQGITGALHTFEWEKEQKAQREEIGCVWV